MDAMRRFAIRKWLLQKLLVSDSKQTSSNQYGLLYASAVMDNIETFHDKKTDAADIAGFRLEADFFKSVPMFVGFGCHAQHWDVSQ